jgi:hypothetical protein
MTLSSTLLQEQPTVILCLEGALASWMLVRDGHSEHSGLHGLARRSVTSYVHGRRVILLKPGLVKHLGPCLCFGN